MLRALGPWPIITFQTIILHRRIEESLDGRSKPMDLVDKEYLGSSRW